MREDDERDGLCNYCARPAILPLASVLGSLGDSDRSVPLGVLCIKSLPLFSHDLNLPQRAKNPYTNNVLNTTFPRANVETHAGNVAGTWQENDAL